MCGTNHSKVEDSGPRVPVRPEDRQHSVTLRDNRQRLNVKKKTNNIVSGPVIKVDKEAMEDVMRKSNAFHSMKQSQVKLPKINHDVDLNMIADAKEELSIEPDDPRLQKPN